MKEFAEALRRLRREAGFASAYQFYHRNGGRRQFPFTYVHYLRLEKGERLPRPRWLAAFLPALRLEPGRAGTRALFLGYLKDLLQTEEAYELVLAPLLGRGAGAPAASPDALRFARSLHTVHLTPKQFRLIASDEATYWCSELLANDSGSWTAPEAAAALGIPAASARAGLRRLKQAGLARESSPGRYRAREAGKLYAFPGRLAGMGGALEKIERYWERRFRKGGRMAGERVELVRAEDAAVRAYASALAQAVDGANAIATHQKGEATGLFLVQAKVRKLFSF